MIYIGSRMWKETVLGSDLLRWVLNGTLPYTQLYDRMPTSQQARLRPLRHLFRPPLPCGRGKKLFTESSIPNVSDICGSLTFFFFFFIVYSDVLGQRRVPDFRFGRVKYSSSMFTGEPWSVGVEKIGILLASELRLNVPLPNLELTLHRTAFAMGLPRMISLFALQSIMKMNEKKYSNLFFQCRNLLMKSQTFDSTFLVFFLLTIVELYPGWEEWAHKHLPRNDREAASLALARTRAEPSSGGGTTRDGLVRRMFDEFFFLHPSFFCFTYLCHTLFSLLFLQLFSSNGRTIVPFQR
jgi:hypothetical protein